MKAESRIWISAPIWCPPLINIGCRALALCGALLIFKAHAGNGYSNNSPDNDRSQIITKTQARDIMFDGLSKDSELASNPAMKEIGLCVFNTALNEIFRENKPLPLSTFESRNHAIFGDDSKKAKLIFIKCAAKSKELEKTFSDADLKSISTPQPIPLLDLDDLRVDYASLEGKKVRVKGIGRYIMDTFLFKKSRTDTNPIFIDSTKISRNQRKLILGKCGDSSAGCLVTITGIVGTVGLQKGILADGITFE